MPEISIITINYNNLQGLQRTMQSVFEQTFTDYEYIIIDGGSADGSKEYIEQHAGKLSYWVSERDSGIYNAMNKGIQKAKAPYLLFLNSGDFFYTPSSLKDLYRNDGADIIYGDIIWDSAGKQEHAVFPDKLAFSYFMGNSLPHQASLIKKSVMDELGGYDESQFIISDWIFFILAICKYNYSYLHVPAVISVCGRDGISCNTDNYEQIAVDRNRVLNEHFPLFLEDYKLSRQQKKENEKMRNSIGYRVQRFISRKK